MRKDEWFRIEQVTQAFREFREQPGPPAGFAWRDVTFRPNTVRPMADSFRTRA